MNKLVKQLTSLLAKQNINAPKPRRRSKGKRSRRRFQRRNAFRYAPRARGFTNMPRALPAAYSRHVRARFRTISKGQNSILVSGCDLIRPIPVTVTNDDDYLFAVITCNPAYWTGTRVGRIAPAYQNYRPLSFSVSYVPQVAVTQAGTVVMGTLWNGTTLADSLQQTLATSNGGLLTPCYTPADTTVTLGTNLPYNLFRMDGELDDQSNPFLFVAVFRGASVVPGYFYVSYQYELKNPIGEAIDYGFDRSLLPFASANIPKRHNVTAVNRSTFETGGTSYGPGTVFDVDWTNNGTVIAPNWVATLKYRGANILVPEDSEGIWDYYWNGPSLNL